MPTQLLTLAQAGAQLGLAPATLRTQVSRGKLTASKVGKTWVITPQELERYRRNHQRHEELPGRDH